MNDGERLLLERRRRGLAAWKLAATSDIDPTTYSHIERGERTATIDQQRRLARALGCEAERLFQNGARLAVLACCFWLGTAGAWAGGFKPYQPGGGGGVTPGQVSNIVSGMTANLATLDQVANAVLGSMSVFAPTNLSAPTISGTVMVGETVTGGTGVWFSALPVSGVWLQWLKDGGGIAGETGLTYSIASGDAGSVLAFRVTMTNALGQATATSAATSAVTLPTWGAQAETEPELVSGGTGYAIDDLLTISGGVYTTPIQIRVHIVDENGTIQNTSGPITDYQYHARGSYTVKPENPASVTGGSGSGAQFNITWQTPAP